MKTIILNFLLLLIAITTYCQYSQASPDIQAGDTVKLTVEGTNAYYQRLVKVDSGITESKIYLRSLQFMASKNFQQNYGYDEEGKLICTTAQDLNTNVFSATSVADAIDPYTVQFAITIDMKNRRYRYTINNIVFYLPDEGGNRRLTMDELYQQATNTDSKRVARDATKVISSFEKYLGVLTSELYQAVEQKRPMDSTKF
jgi:hypothetical protein